MSTCGGRGSCMGARGQGDVYEGKGGRGSCMRSRRAGGHV